MDDEDILRRLQDWVRETPGKCSLEPGFMVRLLVQATYEIERLRTKNVGVNVEWTDRARAQKGWHWLRRRRDGAMRLAFYDGFAAGWRVSDEIGRTTNLSESKVAKLYTHWAAVTPPAAIECGLDSGADGESTGKLAPPE